MHQPGSADSSATALSREQSAPACSGRRRPVPSPDRKMTRVAGRLTPAARVLVATRMLIVPDRKACSITSRTSTTSPAKSYVGTLPEGTKIRGWYFRQACQRPLPPPPSTPKPVRNALHCSGSSCIKFVSACAKPHRIASRRHKLLAHRIGSNTHAWRFNKATANREQRNGVACCVLKSDKFSSHGSTLPPNALGTP